MNKKKFNWFRFLLIFSDSQFVMSRADHGRAWINPIGYDELSDTVVKDAVELFQRYPNLHWIEYYAGHKGKFHYKMNTFYRRDFASRYGFQY